MPLDGIVVCCMAFCYVSLLFFAYFFVRGIQFFEHQTCLENLFLLRYVGIGLNIHAQSLGAVS